MKPFLSLSLLFIICFFLSCNNEAGTTTGSGADSATAGTNSLQQQMLEVNHQIYKGIETGDSALLQKYISENAVDHGGGPDGQDVKGKEILSMLTNFHKDIDNLKMDVEQSAANNEYVFSLVHMTRTTNKPVWGMPANTKMDNRSVDVMRMKDGKVVEHWGYADPVEIMKMMQDGETGQGENKKNTDRTNKK